MNRPFAFPIPMKLSLPAPPRRTRALLVAALTFVAPLAARADTTTHAWFSPYSITVVDAGTNWVSPVVNGFNGGQASLGTFGMTPLYPDGTFYPTQTLSLVFTADAGYAFDYFQLGFGNYSWSNAPFFGGYDLAGNWSVSTGTYYGLDSYAESSWRGYENWEVDGRSGDFSFRDYAWGSGGSGSFRRVMDRDGGFTLPYVSSFTVTFAMNGAVSNQSSFVIALESFVGLVEASQIPDPGPGTSVPDTGATLPLAAAATLALAAARRFGSRIRATGAAA